MNVVASRLLLMFSPPDTPDLLNKLPVYTDHHVPVVLTELRDIMNFIGSDFKMEYYLAVIVSIINI